MNQQKYNALGYGFWLPCGRANFVSTQQDIFIKKSLGPVTSGGLSFGHLSTVDFPERKEPEHECSVLHKVVEVMKEKNFRTGQLIPPEYLENDFTYEDDPEGILLEGEIPNRQNQAIHCKLLVEHNGFYILWTEDTKSLANTDETKNLLKKFLMDLLLGDRSLILNQSEYDTLLPDLKNNPEDHKLLYPYKVEVKDYTGLLPFFQLNMIMEGLNNYFFDPGVFFEKYHHIDAEKLKNFRGLLKQKYGLEEFFTKILTPFEICAPDEHSRNPFNDLIECNEDIITRILRQFLQGTSRSVQEIKWNVERCRRQLLNDMIGVAHRHSDLLQIQSNEEEEENSTPNSALLKGYIIFLEAKLPILLNVQRHIRSVLEEGRLLKEQERFWARMKSKDSAISNNTATLRRAVEIARFALSEVIYSWNALIDGLAESINSIDRAIEQARMDRILHEQEQIRAEQEATAENNRITERSGSSSSIDMDEETSASGANLLTVIGIFLAVVAILVEGIGGQYNPTGDGTPHPILLPVIELYHTVSAFSLIPMALVYVCVIGVVCLVSFVIQLFVHRIIQVMKNVWRQHFGQQIVYFYELDARIEELFKKEARQNLFTGNLDNWVKLYRDKKVEKQLSSKKLRFWNPEYWKKIFEEIPENYFSVHTGKYRWQKWTDWNIVNPFLSLLYSYPIFGKAVFGQKRKKFIMWNLKRRYFRTERIQDDEALHKIQFEAEIILPLNKNRKEPLYGRLFIWTLGIYTIYIWNYRPEQMEIWHIFGMFFFIVCCFIMYLRWRHQRNKQLVPCYFTYEILFHKNPNVNNTFVLRELRFLAQGFQEELSWEESRQLKLCVIYSLIGAWIREGHSKQFLENLEREPITSFLEN